MLFCYYVSRVDKKNDAYSVKGLTINQATKKGKDTFTFTTLQDTTRKQMELFSTLPLPPICIFICWQCVSADTKRKGERKQAFQDRL